MHTHTYIHDIHVHQEWMYMCVCMYTCIFTRTRTHNRQTRSEMTPMLLLNTPTTLPYSGHPRHELVNLTLFRKFQSQDIQKEDMSWCHVVLSYCHPRIMWCWIHLIVQLAQMALHKREFSEGQGRRKCVSFNCYVLAISQKLRHFNIYPTILRDTS